MQNAREIEEEQIENERTHFTWVCEGGDERMRPRGRAMTKGCGYTNFRSTKKDLYNPPKTGIKGTCAACKRKRNLNAGVVRIHHSKQAARRHSDLENWDNANWTTVVIE